MKHKLSTTLAVGLIAILIFISVHFLGQNPALIQSWYTDGVYSLYSRVLSKVTVLFPFSIGDILYIFLITWMLIKSIKGLISKETLVKKGITLSINIVNFTLLFYILFTICWALNNYKTPLQQQLQINLGYTNEQLYALSQKIIIQTNAQHISLTNDSIIKFETNNSRQQILEKTHEVIKNLAHQTHLFTYRPTTLKFSLISTPLSYMGFSGYLNPFSNEAQVNALLPKTTLLVTASHEVAHQLGYALESEANFIGYLAAKKHGDIQSQYASNIFALRYCLGQLKKNEPVYFDSLTKNIYPGVIKNIAETGEFWESYQNITDSFFKLFYSTLLKANNQKQGLRSYNRFVDLLIGYDIKYPLYP